jgi:hypothetical protein
LEEEELQVVIIQEDQDLLQYLVQLHQLVEVEVEEMMLIVVLLEDLVVVKVLIQELQEQGILRQ